MSIPIGGFADSKFKPVRTVFERNFAAEGEIGAALTVYLHGVKVIDLWGGFADQNTSSEWQEDTICGYYSTGKPLIALSLLGLIDEGRIELDDPIVDVWPEFGTAGKDKITYRQLLCHRAGLSSVRKRLPEGAMLDWVLMVKELESQKPWWEPGSRHVYHTNTYGYLVGEPIRRMTGMGPGEYLQKTISGPLQEELYTGVPDGALARVATLYMEGAESPPDISLLDQPMTEEERMLKHGVFNPSGFSSLGVLNTRAWRQAQIPSTNGHGTARGIAHLYSILASGGSTEEISLISSALLSEATALQSRGYCPALEREVDFGLGFQLTRPDRPLGRNPGSFGHFGTGGSLGYADPVAGIGFGYVMNCIKPKWQNSRNRALMEAVYDCL
jgi:CubicO group peptidase (beta-lactamase class C family)